MEKGICYGVSVGPGDPELLTLKSIRIIENTDIIFLPSAPKENCRVYKIIKSAMDLGLIKAIDEERFICIETMPMANPNMQGERYDTLAREVIKYLDNGKSVAFPALGEVGLYSTYYYVHERLVSKGYRCELVSGISSVQEIADKVAVSIAKGDEQVHIFPDTKDLANRLLQPGTKVFMKPKSDLETTIEAIREYAESHKDVKVYGVSNCGTKEEVVARNLEELSNLSGYMTVLIVK